MREEFEAWLLREHGLESEWQEERNCFKDYPAHLAFKAWQASRAALRVELPKSDYADQLDGDAYVMESRAVAKALQQAGIEVKQNG
ncbi:hypothetical protein D0Y56_10845 [Pseudomonas aeruginosa]|nr:hypothetical protein D0Y56_10845 [Pseudomonas aeruginosa]